MTIDVSDIPYFNNNDNYDIYGSDIDRDIPLEDPHDEWKNEQVNDAKSAGKEFLHKLST